MAITKRQRELTNILRNAADEYYNTGNTIMSDHEYDMLVDELAELERESGVSMPNSVVTNVGARVTGQLRKVRHETPMLSLAKTKDVNELVRWADGNVVCLSWKLDGCTVVLTYDNGMLTQAVTRGDGIEGDDITEQAKLFKGVPARIPNDGHVVIRGEALMTYDEFDRINVGGEYKNPRNLASGTIRSLDLNILRGRTIEFHPFELVHMEKMPRTPFANSFFEGLEIMETLGFSSVEHLSVKPDDIAFAVEHMEHNLPGLGFPTDGLVLVYDDVVYGRSLGNTGHHPRNAIALKWADDTHETTLRGIEWQTSRTGRINPVAVFDSVEIEGTTVTRASLHNVTRIRDLELGIGDTITVYKANLIIPAVADNLTRSLRDVTDVLPSRCPVCGGPVSIHNDNGSEFLHCENPDCVAKNVKRLVHFVGRDAMNIMGLSDERMQQLVDAGVVRSYSDVLDLPSKRDEVVGVIDGWGDGTFDNIAAAIESARNTEAARVLYAFGIREVGRTACKAICNEYDNDLERVIDAALKGVERSFTKLDGIGPVMAREVIDYVSSHTDEIRAVISRVNITDKGAVRKVQGSDFVSGKTFVITGSVSRFRNRNEFKAYVEEHGGKVSGSVSRRTSYLVTNTPDSGTSKNRKARELGVAIITENEFCDMAGM